jgi:hypothetical protein
MSSIDYDATEGKLTTSDNGHAPANPYDLKAAKSRTTADIPVHKVFRIECRPPRKHEFFRVHPSPDYIAEAITLLFEDGMEKVTYWVHPDLVDELLLDDAVRATLQDTRIYLAVNTRKEAFLMPCRLPSLQGRGGARWQSSALEVAEEAMDQWVKRVANQQEGRYDTFIAEADFGEPRWPDKTMQELVELAFPKRTIDSTGHEVIAALRGRV